MRISKILSYFVFGLAIVAVSGCSFTYNIKQEILPPPSASALVQKWPLTVGFYMAPSVKSKVFSQQAWRVPAGKEISSTFIWALGQMFAHVVEIDLPPTEKEVPSNLAGVIVMSDASIGDSAGSESLRYEIGFYSQGGQLIDQWSLTVPRMNWDVEQSSFASLIQSVGSEFSYSIRNLTALFMVDFVKHASVQNWLSSVGITELTIGPSFSASIDTQSQSANRVLIVPNIGTWLYTDASRAMSCVGNRLSQLTPPVKVISADTVGLELFPWLEPSTAPKSVEELRNLLSTPAIKNKMRALGVGYLLEFHGGTKTNIPGGGILCGVATGGGGCFGYAWGSRESSFNATILDIKDKNKLSKAISTQKGGVYVPAFIFPIPIMAATESKACQDMTSQIHALIKDAISSE